MLTTGQLDPVIPAMYLSNVMTHLVLLYLPDLDEHHVFGISDPGRLALITCRSSR